MMMMRTLEIIGYESVSYSESGGSVPCQFEDYLKVDFHDWMIIQILFCYLLPSDLNAASVGRSVRRITIGIPFLVPWKPQ